MSRNTYLGFELFEICHNFFSCKQGKTSCPKEMGRRSFLIPRYIFFGMREHGNNRADKRAAYKITDPVDKIPRQSRCNPGYHTIKIESEQKCLRGGVKRAEQKSVQGAYRHINNRSCP